ncbi:ABC transporter permease [Parasphaerochaeta coccoides]|uniref:ABC3 transporter permease protein domain-containing protein n=1 Tax=Parasphaerochaeta coccoides (strain ATCC BAA-1237 / DSM 17374 / SPN1) TaxID=760011 RepID=F4GJX4_PARC1|nr:ABC transporter permease [Parasphaerochaeta coccoides]AEC01399.1 protein of unknown function DUF214 [Parasphaerochaeta coccoides DSM 17374]
MNPLWMVGADMKKNVLASIGTLLLLAIAFSVNVAALALERAVVDSAAETAQEYDLVVGAPGSSTDLVLATVFLRTEDALPLMDFEVYEELKEDSRVAAVSPFTIADSYQGFPVIGISEDFFIIKQSLIPTEGRVFEKTFEAVVGADVSLKVGDAFKSVHDYVEEQAGNEHGHEDISYTVVGKAAKTGTPWDKAIITWYQSLWEIHGYHDHDHKDEDREEAEHEEVGKEELHEEPKIGAVLVKPLDFPSAYALRAEYQNNAGRTTSVFPAEVLTYLFGLFGNFKAVISTLGNMLQALVFLSVILSLLATLPSKYRWIGLLRTLGASRAYVFQTLWMQSAVIFLLSGVIGFFVGQLAAGTLSSFIDSGTGMNIAITIQREDFLPLLVFWFIGLVGALIPAFIGFSVSPRKAVLGQ